MSHAARGHYPIANAIIVLSVVYFHAGFNSKFPGWLKKNSPSAKVLVEVNYVFQFEA